MKFDETKGEMLEADTVAGEMLDRIRKLAFTPRGKVRIIRRLIEQLESTM